MQPLRARGIVGRARSERAIHEDGIGPMDRLRPDERQPDGLRDGTPIAQDRLHVVAGGDAAVQSRIGAAAEAASPCKDSVSDLWIATQRLELEILGMVCCLLEHTLSFVVQIRMQPQHSTLPNAAPPSRYQG